MEGGARGRYEGGKRMGSRNEREVKEGKAGGGMWKWSRKNKTWKQEESGGARGKRRRGGGESEGKRYKRRKVREREEEAMREGYPTKEEKKRTRTFSKNRK